MTNDRPIIPCDSVGVDTAAQDSLKHHSDRLGKRYCEQKQHYDLLDRYGTMVLYTVHMHGTGSAGITGFSGHVTAGRIPPEEAECARVGFSEF